MVPEECRAKSRGKAATELPEAFGLRGACPRFQPPPADGASKLAAPHALRVAVYPPRCLVPQTVTDRPANPVARFFKRTANDSPSAWGEGRDEGERLAN
jgi:hypothetical protein